MLSTFEVFVDVQMIAILNNFSADCHFFHTSHGAAAAAQLGLKLDLIDDIKWKCKVCSEPRASRRSHDSHDTPGGRRDLPAIPFGVATSMMSSMSVAVGSYFSIYMLQYSRRGNPSHPIT